MGLARTAFAAAGACIMAGCATIPSTTNDNDPRLSGAYFMTPYMRERLGDLSIFNIGNELRREENGYVDPIIVGSQRDIESAFRTAAQLRGVDMTQADFYARLLPYVRANNYTGDDEIRDLALATFDVFLENTGMTERDFERIYGNISIGSDTNERLRLKTVLWIFESRSQAFRWFDAITIDERRLCLPHMAAREGVSDEMRQTLLFQWRDVILEEIIHTREGASSGPREEVIAAGLRYDLMVRHFGDDAVTHINRVLAEVAVDRLTFSYFAQNANSPHGIAFDSHPYSAFMDVVDGHVVPEPRLGIESVTQVSGLDSSIFADAQRGQALANASVRDLLLNFVAVLRHNSPDQLTEFNRDIGHKTRQYIAATLLLESGVITDEYALELLREYREAYAFLYPESLPYAERWIPVARDMLANAQADHTEEIPRLPTTRESQDALQDNIRDVFRSRSAVVGVPNRYVALTDAACGGAGPQPS